MARALRSGSDMRWPQLSLQSVRRKNFIKARSERAPDGTTPAMRLGLTDASWRFERILARRLFPTRERVSEFALRVYQKRWTPALPKLIRRHAA